MQRKICNDFSNVGKDTQEPKNWRKRLLGMNTQSNPIPTGAFLDAEKTVSENYQNTKV